MFLYTRASLALPSKQIEATTFALEAAERVSKITGVDVHVTSAMFGAPIGSLRWSGFFDSVADIKAMSTKLLGNADWIEFLSAGRELFATQPEDRVSRFVTEVVTPDDPFYTTTMATMVTGRYAEAAAFGIKISEYIKKSTGLDTAFLKPLFGGFGDVMWIVCLPTINDADLLSNWEMSDAGYQAMLVEAAELYVEASGVRAMVEKLN